MDDDQIGAKNTESDGLTSQGERTAYPRMWIPSSSCFPGAFAPSPPFLLGDLWCYIYPSPWFILLLHLLVIHAHTWVHVPFWRFVSYYDSHRTVQRSRSHKWGQGVSCEYLIWKWQLLLDCFSNMFLWLAHWARNLLWDPQGDCLWRRGAFPFCDFGLPRTTRQYILIVWIPFIWPRALLAPWHGPWAWYEMGRSP